MLKPITGMLRKMVVRIIVNLDEILIMNSTLQGSLRFQVSGWNTRNRRRIKQLGISFSYIFLFFPIRVVGDHVYSSRGKSSALSPAVNDSPDFKGNQILKHMLENLGFVINPFPFLCRSSILWESLWTHEHEVSLPRRESCYNSGGMSPSGEQASGLIEPTFAN